MYGGTRYVGIRKEETIDIARRDRRYKKRGGAMERGSVQETVGTGDSRYKTSRYNGRVAQHIVDTKVGTTYSRYKEISDARDSQSVTQSVHQVDI